MITYAAPGELSWDLVESLFSYGIESCMRLEPQDLPLMLTEGLFNTPAAKEQVSAALFY